MPASPDILNYAIGKATVSWTPTGGAARDLGNAPEIEITPNIEFLDHFSSRSGIRSKDRSVAVETGATVRVVLDEITADNLAMLLFGSGTLGVVGTNSAGEKEFDILAVAEVTGALTVTGTNSVGNKFTMVLPSVSFQPTGSWAVISEEWNTIEITGEVLESDGSFGTVTETEVAA
jgi:hypothetical protein